MIIKKALKYSTLTILSITIFILIYLFSAYVLSRISIAEENDLNDEVTIYIKTNGVHTDIVVPVRNDQIDWSKEVKFSHLNTSDTTFQYLGMGWGDKGFYLDTPTWAELKASVAFKAATGLNTTAIHATYFYEMEVDSTCKRIDISKNQYGRLINYISKSFQKDQNGHFIKIETNANYGKTDAFYEAVGRYHLLHTCNTWANTGLKKSGQKCCYWTPFDTGIFLNYK